MSDRLDVAELTARLSRLLDENRPDDVRTVYTEDVVVHSPRTELHGIDAVVSYLRQSRVADEQTVHVNADVLVTVDGDQAQASANQFVYYYRDGEPPHQTSALRVAYTAVRTLAGWRFNTARLELAWTQKN